MTSTDEHHVLALDLGSSSVRAVLGTYRQGAISTEEVFRLHHQAVDDHGTLTWDLERIMDGVRRSIAMATQRLGRAPDSIGIDTWGVDYGLLDAHGELLRAPRAYRDRRMARWAADLDRALDRALVDRRHADPAGHGQQLVDHAHGPDGEPRGHGGSRRGAHCPNLRLRALYSRSARRKSTRRKSGHRASQK